MLNKPAPPHVLKLREEIKAKLTELDALTKANAAADGWGAALTARNERIAALRRELTTIATGRASFHKLTVENEA